MRTFLTFAGLLALAISGMAQTERVEPNDTHAWEAVLTVACERPSHSTNEKVARTMYRHQMRLEDFASSLAEFCRAYDSAVDAYNEAVRLIDTNPAQPITEHEATRQLGQCILAAERATNIQRFAWTDSCLNHDAAVLQDRLLMRLVDLVQTEIADIRNGDPEHWDALDLAVVGEKANMNFVPEVLDHAAHAKLTSGSIVCKPHFCPPDTGLKQATYVNSSYQVGYTTYQVVNIDQWNVSSVVQVTGTYSSNQCTWDPYHGQWQPPSCPAFHTPTIANYIGPYGATTSGSTVPYNSYLAQTATVIIPVANISNKTEITAIARVFCTVLSGYVIWWDNSRPVQLVFSKVKWNGHYAGNYCYTTMNCSNAAPWALNISEVWVAQPGQCSPGWKASAVCVYNAVTLTWWCPSIADVNLPSDTTPEYCSPATKLQ